MIKKNYFWY